MNVYIIKASAPGPFKTYKKAMGAPPQNIFSLAAATPGGVGVTLCDETIGMKPRLKIDADIIAILFHTPDAVHAYAMADKFRAKGKTTVLGGIHPSLMPGEAAAHADSLLIGEAEGIWEDLLDDYQNNCLKPEYRRETPVDLATVNPYPLDLIPPSKYEHIWSVLVSRGCVHRCDFCAVPPFFSGKYRKRPIENIVAEIKAAPTDWVELHADNLTADRDYALELFKALTPLNINWMGESTIKLADDAELLQAAARSGCKWLLIGIETPSRSALQASGKGFVSPDDIRDKISRFHDHGIKISSSMIFGFDTHTPEIFRESEDFCRYIGIDEVESVILIPFPGTPLYKRMDSENRLLTKDWSRYNGDEVVFSPAGMTADELKKGSLWFWNEIRKQKPVPQNRKTQSAPRGRGNPAGPALSTGAAPLRWKSVLALGIIGMGLWFEWYWIWGVLFIIWAITDLRNRRTYLLDDIPRSDSPLLYWTVVLMWLIMGIWALSTSPALSGITAAVLPTAGQFLT
ncbi:MAG: B12-binding domain-containing radical SAM protein [Desulfobacterales bacterium]|nr:B12-binding domain-containing radical SAM protein [Desulfobacterales bacterium]